MAHPNRDLDEAFFETVVMVRAAGLDVSEISRKRLGERIRIEEMDSMENAEAEIEFLTRRSEMRVAKEYPKPENIMTEVERMPAWSSKHGFYEQLFAAFVNTKAGQVEIDWSTFAVSVNQAYSSVTSALSSQLRRTHRFHGIVKAIKRGEHLYLVLVDQEEGDE